MSDTSITPTPDFSEPWKPAFTNCFHINTGDIRHFECGWRDRAIARVNACAGMGDPAKEITAMRDAIQKGAMAIDRLTTAAAGGMQPANAKQDAIRFGNAVLTELQSFIMP